MSHSLQQQIESISRRAWRLLILHGLCWFVFVGVAAAFVFGWIDYAIRPNDRGVRTIISVVVAAILLWSFRRFLLPVLGRQFTHLEVAQQLEQRFPQLGDRLSSSLNFLNADHSELFESDKLRQTVVSETEALARSLDFQECLDSRATHRSIIACLALCAVLAIVCWLDLDATALAARRMMVPWSTESWPRWNALEVVDTPSRIALGQDVEITIRDRRRRLPDQVMLQVWHDGDSEDEVEAVSMQRAEQLFRYQQRNVTRDFQFRATGGDDDSMAWRRMEVVEPVQLGPLKVKIEPPAYSGIVPHELADGPVHVLEGSRVSMTATTNRPIEVASLHVSNADEEIVVAASIADDGKSFAVSPESLPTTEPLNGQYWIEMVEADGVVSVSDTRWPWKVVADKLPVVTVITPALESYFTATASVPLRVKATDDLAIQQINVTVGTRTIPLFVGPDAVPPKGTLTGTPEVREVARALELGEFKLQPNDAIELTFTASDYKPQTSERITRVITIISRDDFDYRSQDRQKRLLAKLIEALRLQRATKAQITSLETQLRTANSLSGDDIHRLRAGDVQQQQVVRILSDQPGGAAQLVGELIADLDSNKASDSEIVSRMNRLAAALNTINQNSLPALQSDMLRATKLARDVSDESKLLESLLTSIGTQQDGVADKLQRMIDLLSQWDDYRRFARDVNELIKEQQTLLEDVKQLPTLGRRMDDLTDQLRADLERAAGQQQDLAKRVDRLKFDMRRLKETVADSDPTAAAALSSALGASQSSGLSERMRTASNEIATNRLGKASRSQTDIEAGLQQVLSALTDTSGRSGQAGDDAGPQQVAAALAELNSRLSRVASRQQTLIEETTGVIDLPSRSEKLKLLASDQQSLADQVGQIRDELLLPKAIEFGVSSVQSNMQDAAESLGHHPRAQTAVGAQRRAMARLNQLLNALSAETKESPNSSAPQSPAASGDSTAGAPNGEPPALTVEELRLLHGIQLELIERTSEIEQQRSEQNDLNDRQRASLERLATEQGTLAELLLKAIPPEPPKKPRDDSDIPDVSEDELNRLLEDAGIPGF